jgi:DNA-binding beta-propeller fold protein YncE
MPVSETRHQRRTVAARARTESRAHDRRRRPVLIACAAGLVVIGLAVGVWLLAGRPSAAPPGSGGADVTPLALPTFAANAPETVLEATGPEILTPTPGVAGPTAVVITSSPWQVLIARGVLRDLTSPSDVAVDAAGNLWVADFEGDFVQKFSPGGQPLERIGQKGSAPGQFAGPSGVTVDGQGNVYVADTNNQRIQKLSASGQSLALWGKGGDGPGQFRLPSGVAVDDLGKVYVADRGNHRIQVLSPGGEPLAQWGTRGPAPGQFWAPSGVAVDQKGQLYVADSTNQRVQVLSASGQPLAQWGWEGADPGRFEFPSSVAVDSSGNVYVSDTRNSRIQKLSSAGEPLAVWGIVTGANTPRPAPQPGTFNAPGGIAVDRDGALYVADTRNARIQKLKQ